MLSKRATELQPGDRLYYTDEVVIRTFKDKMTKPYYICVLLRKGQRERLAHYRIYAFILIVRGSHAV
jgi:hypothetical protein